MPFFWSVPGLGLHFYDNTGMISGETGQEEGKWSLAGGSGWSGSLPPVVQDPSAPASDCRPLLLLHNATLIRPAAVTQAWPCARPSASAGVASEHVNRPPVPLLSTSSPIPTLPLPGIKTWLCLG